MADRAPRRNSKPALLMLLGASVCACALRGTTSGTDAARDACESYREVAAVVQGDLRRNGGDVTPQEVKARVAAARESLAAEPQLSRRFRLLSDLLAELDAELARNDYRRTAKAERISRRVSAVCVSLARVEDTPRVYRR